jgi:hypothetical protein
MVQYRSRHLQAILVRATHIILILERGLEGRNELKSYADGSFNFWYILPCHVPQFMEEASQEV